MVNLPTSSTFHIVNFPLCQFPLCQFPLDQYWPNGNWRSGKVTMWEVDKVGIDKVGTDKVGIDKVGITHTNTWSQAGISPLIDEVWIMNTVNRLVSLNIIQLAIFPMECGKRRSKLDIVKIHSSSVSPHLTAALCSFMRVSRALFVSPIYTLPQLQGIWYTTLDLFSSGSWSLTFVSCPRRVDADWKIVRMLYLLHTHLTSSLRPAT